MPRDQTIHPFSSAESYMHQIEKLKAELETLERGTATTVRFDTAANVDDPIEGEAIIDYSDNRLKWYLNGEWHYCVCGEAPGCDFGLYSLRAQVISFVRPVLDYTTDYPEFYLQADIWIPQASIDAFISDEVSPGSLLSTVPAGGREPGLALVLNGTGGLKWVYWTDFGSYPPPGEVLILDETPSGNTCHTIGIHTSADGVQMKIDENIYDVSSEVIGAMDNDQWYVGQYNSSGDYEYPPTTYGIYFDNVKAGTTGWGAIDIFSDDFETGDLSVGSYNDFGSFVEVVAAPS